MVKDTKKLSRSYYWTYLTEKGGRRASTINIKKWYKALAMRKCHAFLANPINENLLKGNHAIAMGESLW